MQTCCARLTQNDSDEIAAGAQTHRTATRVLLERPTAVGRRSAGTVRLAAQAHQRTLDSTTTRRARSMDDRLECDGGSTRHACARVALHNLERAMRPTRRSCKSHCK